MTFIRPSPLRLSRRMKRFNSSLIAALAAMALSACGAGPEPVTPPSSIARGVQQILHSSGERPLHFSQQPTGRQS